MNLSFLTYHFTYNSQKNQNSIISMILFVKFFVSNVNFIVLIDYSILLIIRIFFEVMDLLLMPI
jgi:hypothetical protein